MEKIIIGFSGRLGSGKNYIAEELFVPLFIKKYNKFNILPYFFSFGDQPKIECLCRNNYNYESLFINKTNETRKLLQNYATENGRDKYGPDIWIRALDTLIKIQTERTKPIRKINNTILLFIISDVRFENEKNYIEMNGGTIINIIAPNRTRQKMEQEQLKETHISETSLLNHNFKYTINNDNRNNDDIIKELDIILNIEYNDKL